MQTAQRVRVKICGLTRPQDVRAAVRAGADAIGMVFYAGSKRAVEVEQARALRQAVPAFVSVVALFVNADPAHVAQVIDRVQPDLLQFHGDETPAYCRSFGRRYLRAFRVGGPGMDSVDAVAQECQRYPDAAGWLFDSFSAGYGGSGLALDTALLPAGLPTDAPPLILAGGLTPESVGAAVRAVRPYAVDVSSGVELSPGLKCEQRVLAFLRAAQG